MCHLEALFAEGSTSSAWGFFATLRMTNAEGYRMTKL